MHAGLVRDAVPGDPGPGPSVRHGEGQPSSEGRLQAGQQLTGGFAVGKVGFEQASLERLSWRGLTFLVGSKHVKVKKIKDSVSLKMHPCSCSFVFFWRIINHLWTTCQTSPPLSESLDAVIPSAIWCHFIGS